MDASRYNDGLRGGAVRVRARISKIDKRTLAITEIPFSTTSESIKESIIKANDKGKIKIRKVDDNTAEKVEIIIQVAADESSDKTIDALYAFTDCEVSISPNACVIVDDKPVFMGVSDILRRSADHTRMLLGRELEIRLNELNEAWHAASLERIFIENKLYQLIEGCRTREAAYEAVDKGLAPFKKALRREVTIEDVQRLTELKFIRISRYDSEKADNEIKQIEVDIASTKDSLAHLTDYTVEYYERIRAKYGAGRERRTEIREFDTIEAWKVASTNARLYVDREEGFFGYGKSMKGFGVGLRLLESRRRYSHPSRRPLPDYEDQRKGLLRQGHILYRGLQAQRRPHDIQCPLPRRQERRDNDEALRHKGHHARPRVRPDEGHAPQRDTLHVGQPQRRGRGVEGIFQPRPRLKRVITDLDFSTLAIKGRQSQGNLFSRYSIHKIVLKEKGRLDARRPEHILRRGCATAQCRRPRYSAGRI